MNGPRDEPFFLCSPIPRDPTQLLFVDDSATRPQTTTTAKSDSFFDPEAEEMTGLQRADAAPASPAGRSSIMVDVTLEQETKRAAKRPRVEEQGAVVVKNDHLTTEVASLRLQLESHHESHQLQLKERDFQLSQLRRQLQYALSEEEHARTELKTLTKASANEKLTLQQKVVELESKLQFVESSFNEWREKADDTANELRAVVRESKLKIQLLADELEIAKSVPTRPTPTPVEYSVLESKMKHLEVSLLDKERQVQHADDRILNASAEIEASRDTRWMKERIVELESQERRLKQELVALIESSRSSALYDEKMMQTRQKLLKSDERFDAAQKELIESHQRHEEEVARLKEEAKAMQNDMKKLTTQLEKTERECAVLEKRLGRGEYNPQKIKVVHMSVNPTSELLGAKQETTTSELEELRREVEQLRSQLVGSSSEPAGAPPRTPMEMVTPANKSTTSSKLTTTTSYETVEGQKLLNQRLKEVFQNQIQQYREAVYQLTGFKVDLKKSNGMELLRLRSMYADHDDDELLVRMEPSGALELLETDFCGQINKRVFAYLTTCRSFPAFLSTLTLHLFEKQTFQGN